MTVQAQRAATPAGEGSPTSVFAAEDGAEARQRREWRRPTLSRGTVFVLGAINLIDCINISLLTPYVDRMVSEFMGLPTDDSHVVQTVGVLIGLYSLCEVLCSPFWGCLADRYGRRPIMLVGLAGSAVAPLFFGAAGSLPMAFFARGLDGFFCGNVGVTKTYLGELVDASNEARGFGFLAICFSLGLIIGPVLGGQLVDPAQWAPQLFAGTIFEQKPYLLPNLTYACFAASAWVVGYCSLPETLPPWQRKGCVRRRSTERSTALLDGDAQVASSTRFRGVDWSAIKVIGAYCLVSGYYAAWSQDFALIVSLPRSMGGFGLGPHEIGALTNAAGIGLLSTQLLFYPCSTKRFGFLACFTFGLLLNLVVTLLFPLYGAMADPAVFGYWRFAPLSAMQFLGQAGSGFAFPTIFVWLNRALEGKDKGTWNGYCNSCGALVRSFFPPLAAALLSLGLRSGLPGGRYLPVFGNGFAILGALALATSAIRDARRNSCGREVLEAAASGGDAEGTAQNAPASKVSQPAAVGSGGGDGGFLDEPSLGV